MITYNLKPFNRDSDSGWLKLGEAIECPKCLGKGKGCMISTDQDRAVCTRDSSKTPFSSSSKFPSWIHILKETDKKEYKLEVKDEDEDVPEATDAQKDVAYKRLKAKYPLNDADKEYLKSCGLIDTSRYFSLPAPVDKKWNSLEHNFDVAEGVPGFYQVYKHKKINAFFWGLCCVQKNIDGQIIGVEIRASDECKEHQHKAYMARYQTEKTPYIKKGSIYRPLVSSGKPLGQTVSQFISVYGKNDGEVIWVTEGLKKAQVLHEQTGDLVITVRGVGNWAQQMKAIEKLHKRNPKLKKVMIAYDLDKDNKSGKHLLVKSAYEGILAALNEYHGLHIATVEWNDEYKGVDDALNAGIKIDELTYLPENNVVYDDINVVREGLVNSMRTAMLNGRKGMEVFAVSAGVGKTYTAIKIINDLHANGWPQVKSEDGKSRDMRIAMCFENKKLVNEMLALFDFSVKPLEGRNNVEGSDYYCIEKDFIDVLGASGRNTFKHGCGKCDFIDICPYIKNMKKAIKKRFVLTNKAALMNRSDRLDEFDVVIVDESIRDQIIDEDVVTVQDMKNYKAVYYSMMRSYEKVNLKDESKLWELHGENIFKISGSLAEYHQQKTKEFIKHHDEIERLINLTESHDLGKGVEKIEVKLFGDSIDLIDSFKISPQYAEGLTGNFHEDNLHVYPKNILLWSEWASKKDFFIEPGIDGNKLLIRDLNHHTIKKLNNMKVLNLDATPINDLFSVFDNVTHHEFVVKEHIHVKTITNTLYSKRQLFTESYQDKMLDMLKWANDEYDGNIAIMTSKSFKDVITDRTEIEESTIGYFNRDTRGSNNWKAVSALVLVGRYIENIDAVDRDVQLLVRYGVETSLERLSKQISDAEMKQAVARGRGVNRTKENPLVVIKASRADIPGILPDEYYLSLKDMMAGVTKQEAKRAKIMSKKSLTGKDASNQVTEPSGPPPSNFVYNTKNKADQQGGSLDWYSEVLPKVSNMIDRLLKTVLDTDGINKDTWAKFINAIKRGIYSISDLSEAMGNSKSTVKRYRKALVDWVAANGGKKDSPSLPIDLPKEEMTEYRAELAEYARGNYTDELMAHYKSKVPYEKIKDFYFALPSAQRTKELTYAMGLCRDENDYSGEDETLFWIEFMCAYENKLLSYVYKNKPSIVLEFYSLEN